MSLKNNETPMLHWYWHQVGGTLIEEFYAVKRGRNHSERRIDGIIIRNGEHTIKKQSDISVEGKDLIVVQVKTGRLGMYLLGQTVFSAKLMEMFRPKSISAVALCEKSDDVLEAFLVDYPDISVVVYGENAE